jgi:uncharacterized hydrophobic protein (TIGR00341 family)
MKKIEITSELDHSEELLNFLNQINLQNFSTSVKMGDQTVRSITVFVPDEFVDELITQISEKIDLRRKANMISVIEVEGVVSTYLDRFKEKAVKINPPPNPIERLVETTDKYTRLNVNILLFVFFATIIALTGLFMDNIAVIIGAMLLSPMLGPINAFAVNANLGRIKSIIRSQAVSLQLLLFVITSAAFITYIALICIPLNITSQIAIRSQASLIDIVLAFVLGCAGGLALFTDFPEILVGVAVAVALVPPAAVTGIGVAMMDFGIATGAFLLSIINLLGMQLGCTIMLNLKGVTPRQYYQRSLAKRYYKYFVYIVAILLLVISLIVLRSNILPINVQI